MSERLQNILTGLDSVDCLGEGEGDGYDSIKFSGDSGTSR
jgi:hypothetical protein